VERTLAILLAAIFRTEHPEPASDTIVRTKSVRSSLGNIVFMRA
jgi:hypothetical protein